jgi:hypothetical protein
MSFFSAGKTFYSVHCLSFPKRKRLFCAFVAGVSTSQFELSQNVNLIFHNPSIEIYCPFIVILLQFVLLQFIVFCYFCDTSLITACAIFCHLKFHVVCTCAIFESSETPFASWQIGKWSRDKTVTLIDLHIVLTYDCWQCFLVFNIWVSHALEKTINFITQPLSFVFHFTQPFISTHSKCCLPNPFLFAFGAFCLPNHFLSIFKCQNSVLKCQNSVFKY